MNKDEQDNKALFELAQTVGIVTTYESSAKEKITATPEVILSILNSLGIAIEHAKDAPHHLKQQVFHKLKEKISKNIVLWDGKAKKIPLYLEKKEENETLYYEIKLEDGEVITKTLNLKTIKGKSAKQHGIAYREKLISLPKLPIGYHQLTVQIFKKTYKSLLISAPSKFYTENVNQEPCYGVFAPIYALHNKENSQCGDLSTFREFSAWIAEQGAKVVATMPFFASFSENRCEPSPYSPVSRLFWNDLFLDLSQVDDALEHRPEETIAWDPLVNYREAAHSKRQRFMKQVDHYLTQPHLKQELEEYRAKCPLVNQYALFRAKNELTNDSWQVWPSEQQGNLNLEPELESYYHYHLLAQWQFDKQLRAFKQELNQRGQLLYLDLPVGVHGDGFDAWYFKNDFMAGVSIGAPPDPVFKDGQNWGSPPLNPLALRETHFYYFIKMLRNIFQYVDILRIDHVMGFNRLFWIPENFPISQGTYVQYPAEEMYAILSIESNRFKASIIGENLGCVPPITNKMMSQHDMLPMNITQYLLESKLPLVPKEELMLTSLNTHDMPTFFSFCQGLDIEKARLEKPLSNKEFHQALQVRKRQLNRLRKTLIQHDLNEDHLLEASLTLLASSKAKILIVNIEDLWQEMQGQNIPASGAEEPNWRRKLVYSIEQMKTAAVIVKRLQLISDYRAQKVKKRKQATTVSLISKEDLYLFNEGTHYQLYRHLGAHIRNEQEGVYFTVWAPNAKYVSVIGSFNYWNRREHPMAMINSSGIWETYIPQAKVGDYYKFYIESNHHHFSIEKADPFAFYQEVSPKTASVVWKSNYQWQDQPWLETRAKHQHLNSPIAIYEVHLGSWRRVPEEGNRFLTYRELAPLLTDYLVKMNFTHVEFLPVMEHPFYGSWGYQTTGYFAPSSRYGTPDDFKYLIDYLHQHNIGVILDWVPSHFPNDEYGLAYFDGTHLFEHSDPKKGFHPDWKSAIFNYGRHEVKAFLISSALYWLDEYHIDGLRVDAVASMLYLNYSRSEGEWIPNRHGGHENLEAIEFIKELNRAIYHRFPDVQTFAEESTAWPGVSRPTYIGGLGFGFKWDMGWMHDTLSYLQLDPIYRRHHQHRLSFRMIYAFNENFTLALSHDETVHGKGSLYNKMPGGDWDKFANLRLLFGYMYASPGKKLLFMGNEFGQKGEWNHESSLDWHLLQDPLHQGLQKWVAELNKLYRSEPALHELEHEPTGFDWIDCQDAENSVYSFLRKSAKDELLLIIINCTPITRLLYRVGVPKQGQWKLLSSSDAVIYGGAGNEEKSAVAEAHRFHHRDYSMNLTLPGLSVSFYKWIKD